MSPSSLWPTDPLPSLLAVPVTLYFFFHFFSCGLINAHNATRKRERKEPLLSGERQVLGYHNVIAILA